MKERDGTRGVKERGRFRRARALRLAYAALLHAQILAHADGGGSLDARARPGGCAHDGGGGCCAHDGGGGCCAHDGGGGCCAHDGGGGARAAADRAAARARGTAAVLRAHVRTDRILLQKRRYSDTRLFPQPAHRLPPLKPTTLLLLLTRIRPELGAAELAAAVEAMATSHRNALTDTDGFARTDAHLAQRAGARRVRAASDPISAADAHADGGPASIAERALACLAPRGPLAISPAAVASPSSPLKQLEQRGLARRAALVAAGSPTKPSAPGARRLAGAEPAWDFTVAAPHWDHTVAAPHWDHTVAAPHSALNSLVVQADGAAGECVVPRLYSVVVDSITAALALELALWLALSALHCAEATGTRRRSALRLLWARARFALRSVQRPGYVLAACAVALVVMHPSVTWRVFLPCGYWSLLTIGAWTMAFREATRLIAIVPGVRAETRRLKSVVVAVLPYVALQLCWIHCFASIGILAWGALPNEALRGTDFHARGYADVFNFQNYGSAFMLLFQVLCENNWNVTAEAYVRASCRHWLGAWVYFVLFLYLHAMLLLNVLTGAMIKLYSYMREQDDLERMSACACKAKKVELDAELGHALKIA
ncbi:hypothetical protein KFE25_001737 [Diacronema lutheri]|uniref:Ion transport domain-containing protein n=1 Tax=Diacronema lutheri TaxID=2081491 RepID=A0A8J5XLN2_DIALT|nr:hypothetical protein KFE25_001737 [Diacronema lutheri]